ncbi:MAG: cyclic nucleotide-binding domain-containing protein [Desulfuromusa sp.]|nr:cyclic nucleotide-binding domain-containing protein [Desulfuromusa sp.]
MNPFWHNIFRINRDEQTLAYFLGTLPAFKELDKSELSFLENIVHLRNYHADEMVFSKGDIGSGMYAIRSGQVQIYSRDEQGRETEQANLKAGDFFGEVALTASRPRCASARSTEPTVLIGLFRSDMLEAVRRHPVPAAKILVGLNRVVSDRLLQCSIQLDQLKKQLAILPEQKDNE